MISEKIIKAYALKNAVEHEGEAVAGSIISALFNYGLKKEKIKDIMPNVNKVLKEINGLEPEEQKVLFEKYKDIIRHRPEREGLPELPNVNKKTGVIMRFRPAPSGPLHVGHIISNLPNSLYVEKYGGKLYVIIDDTNPKETLKDAYENIKKDCDWIFGNVYKYLNASDRMDLYYKYAKELINKGFAYVCDCNPEKFKELILKKKECPCRKLSKTEQLKRWEKMLDKNKKTNYKQGKVVLRFKSDMNNPNPALRDFPLARINEHKHPLQKDKYRVWPLMNLSVAVDDIELKMTHIIRGKDHKDNAKRQEMIFNVFNKKYPVCFFMGRIKFNDLVLSKRKISALIQQGEFSGSDDEKLATISSLKKRGYKKQAFVKFIEQRGISEVDKVMSQADFFKILDDSNKENK
ncbi:MAG: glutamate--tRNA ligase family protein [Nanoarchaeota archaeon]